MESNKETNIDKEETKHVTDTTVKEEDTSKKDLQTDMKKYITKVDNRVKTKVKINLIFISLKIK